MKRSIPVVVGLVVLLGLAYAHWILPAKVEASMNAVLPHAPYEISDRAQRLHESLFIADLHAESLLWKRDLATEANVGHVDIPRLQRGNVALQVFSATTKSPAGQNYDRNGTDSDRITRLAVASFWPPRTWFSLYERAAYELEKLHDLASKSELEVVTSRRDLQRLVGLRRGGERVLGAVYLIEGAHPLEGDIRNLDRLFEPGLRVLFGTEAGR